MKKNSPLEGDSLILLRPDSSDAGQFWENKHTDESCSLVVVLCEFSGRQEKKRKKEDFILCFLGKGEKVFMLMDIWTVTFGEVEIVLFVSCITRVL